MNQESYRKRYEEIMDKFCLMDDDFRCTSAKGMHYKVLADRVRYFKETEGGRENMCKLMEDLRDEIAKDVAIESAVETARQFDISEDAILGNIMGRFNLTESEAKSYMLKKSA